MNHDTMNHRPFRTALVRSKSRAMCIGFALTLSVSLEPALVSSFAAELLFHTNPVVTLFAFDSVSIPFTHNLRLTMCRPVKHEANPVVERGGPGSPDEFGVQFYGSVARDHGRFRMWYVAVDRELEGLDRRARSPCSADGHAVL
ncbi:MAG: hypothetical protein O2960_29935 [Verrucomicrobia bacterium]|nr:hypothetical protein [Verrucomicrobiota bacterium]